MFTRIARGCLPALFAFLVTSGGSARAEQLSSSVAVSFTDRFDTGLRSDDGSRGATANLYQVGDFAGRLQDVDTTSMAAAQQPEFNIQLRRMLWESDFGEASAPVNMGESGTARVGLGLLARYRLQGSYSLDSSAAVNGTASPGTMLANGGGAGGAAQQLLELGLAGALISGPIAFQALGRISLGGGNSALVQSLQNLQLRPELDLTVSYLNAAQWRLSCGYSISYQGAANGPSTGGASMQTAAVASPAGPAPMAGGAPASTFSHRVSMNFRYAY